MARRVFLHIGTPKSGTTYVQSLWWRNRDALASQGLLLPGGSEHVQFHAGAVIRDNAGVLATMDATQKQAWERLLAEMAEWEGDALVSQEQLVEADADHARDALRRALEVAEQVHVIITARDLARQIPSAWQQRVKHGSDTTLKRFCARVAKDDPDFNFWRHQDVPRILERWGEGLPPERVHVVPLPRPGAPRELLWTRVCALLGVDDTPLALEAPRANETLGPEEIELLRQVNAHFPRAHHDVAMSRHLRRVLDSHLGRGADNPRRLTLAPDTHAWAVERGNRMVDELGGLPYDVVGDLDDLRPEPTPVAGAVPAGGVDPDQVTDHEVLAAATALIAALVRESAPRAGSQHREPHAGAPSPDAPESRLPPGSDGRGSPPARRWRLLPRRRR